MPARITPVRRRPPSRRWRRLAAPAAVAGGGLVGSAARAAISANFPGQAGSFPVTTLLVNITGSLLLGLYLARRQRAVTRRWSLQFWAIGALGSFTTFSTFSVEVVRLADAGAWVPVGWYVLASTLLGLAAALLGQRLGRAGR
jgi:CrcB protein